MSCPNSGGAAGAVELNGVLDGEEVVIRERVVHGATVEQQQVVAFVL